LGREALRYGIIAGGVGLILIFAFLIFVYKGLGAIACFALLLYTELLILFLAIVPWVQLTLPGIAGIILSIGMAIDANIVIFERIKEERRMGRSMHSAVKGGFKKALSAIVDGNLTTLIAAIVLLIFGAAAIQGFAIVLLIGILLSMFTAIVVTRLLINIAFALNDHNDAFYGLELGVKLKNA
jgi:SecD/SecF fusion protein